MQAVEHTHDFHHEHDHDHEHHHDHRRENTQYAVRAVLLIGLALYFAYNILSGNLSNYVNERFAWMSYLAVLLFGALGMVSLIALRRGDHVHHDHEGHDHSHEPIGWSVIAIVAIPLVLGTLIPSRPLGAEAVAGNITTSAVSIGSASVITKDALERNVLDWLRVFSSSQNPADFNGQQAIVEGFVYREPDYPVDMFMVARFTVSCCVADASAIGLPVTYADAASIGDGTWVRISGDFAAGQFVDQQVPILQVASLTTIDQPDHPYLYP